MEHFTLEEVKMNLPAKLRPNATQELVDKLNNISDDPEAAKQIRENFVSYTSVLQDGKFKTEDYIYAVKYVTYKVMGYTNKDAYVKTFPDRYRYFVQNGTSEKDIASYITSYNKGKLVNLILEQTLVPTWVLNQDIYQEAINTQARLMRTAKSERVQAMAAESILSHLAKPEAVDKAQLNININAGSQLEDLQKTLVDLAKSQQELIKSGVSTKAIAEQRIIDVEPETEPE